MVCGISSLGRQRGRQVAAAERQAGRKASRQRGQQAERQAGRQGGRQRGRQGGKQAGRERESGRGRGREGGREREREMGGEGEQPEVCVCNATVNIATAACSAQQRPAPRSSSQCRAHISSPVSHNGLPGSI